MVDTPHLFQQGSFALHSGNFSQFKIECDALTTCDWDTLALLVAEKMRFYRVVGIPSGGLMFETSLERYVSGDNNDPWLIVDDVLTTGKSMEKVKNKLTANNEHEICGVVVFARRKTPDWIESIFQMW